MSFARIVGSWDQRLWLGDDLTMVYAYYRGISVLTLRFEELQNF